MPHARPRSDRRKAATRQRLLAATRTLIAEQGVDAATIAAIAEHADVGFGTFYLHFSSKEEAISTVVGEIAERLGASLDAVTAGMDDPAEVVAVSVRHVVGVVDRDATWAWLLVRLDASTRLLSAALGPRMRRDLAAGLAAGRLTGVADGLTPIAVGAITLGALRARLDGGLGPDAPEQAAEHVLRLLGLDAADAAEIARRPLPELDGA